MSRRPRVFATRRLPGSALGALAAKVDLELWTGRGAPTPSELARAAAGAEGLLCLLSDRVDADLLSRCPGLRVISSYSVGLDHVDLAAATARGVPVGHTPGVLTETTADLAFGLLLAGARRIAEADRWLRSGAWARAAEKGGGWAPDLLLGRDVHGAVLGIVGLGATGQAVARRAQGFGMRVLGWSRTPRRVPGVEAAQLPRLLAEADFVTLHLALTPQTRGLLGREALARMKPRAWLVNAARGGLVDEAALAEALGAGRLGGAALDVYEREPLAPDSPLLRLGNVVLTPHIGSASVETRSRMAALAVENLLAGLEGRRLPHCANPEVYAGAAAPGAPEPGA